MNLYEKYTNKLDSVWNQILQNAQSSIDKIVIPDSPIISTNNTPTKPNSNKVSLILGIVLVVLGIVIKSTLWSIICYILGGLLLLGGLMQLTKSQKRNSQTKPETINLFDVVNQIYTELSSIHGKITDTWSNELTSLQNEILSEINQLPIDIDMKNKVSSQMYYKSVIEVSMMDTYSELNQIQRSKDINQLKEFKDKFKKRYTEALNKAYQEQVNYYEALKELN